MGQIFIMFILKMLVLLMLYFYDVISIEQFFWESVFVFFLCLERRAIKINILAAILKRIFFPWNMVVVGVLIGGVIFI